MRSFIPGSELICDFSRFMAVCLPQRFPTVPFARCLESLPNLHTLEIGWMDGSYARLLGNALSGVELPQIKTLILPPAACALLRHCPSVEDVVYVVGGATSYNYQLVDFLSWLASNKNSKVRRLAIPLASWDNRTSKQFSSLYYHRGVRMITNRLQSQNTWPRARGLPNSPSFILIHLTPTKPQERELCLTQPGVYALRCWD